MLANDDDDDGDDVSSKLKARNIRKRPYQADPFTESWQTCVRARDHVASTLVPRKRVSSLRQISVWSRPSVEQRKIMFRPRRLRLTPTFPLAIQTGGYTTMFASDILRRSLVRASADKIDRGRRAREAASPYRNIYAANIATDVAVLFLSISRSTCGSKCVPHAEHVNVNCAEYRLTSTNLTAIHYRGVAISKVFVVLSVNQPLVALIERKVTTHIAGK